jgi:ATP-dependent RNA helicase DDX35
MFWRPGNEGPSTENSTKQFNNPTDFYRKLPIYKSKIQIQFLIEQFQTLIITGETGSGKSTQLCQYLHEAGWTKQGRMIGVAQTNATNCKSIASSMDSNVGYQIEFERSYTNQTVIKYFTVEVVLKELLSDPLLSLYSVIIVDDVHERKANQEILMSILKKIMKKRPDFRVVLCSATDDNELYKSYFNNAITLNLESRLYPVKEYFLNAPCRDFIEETVETVFKIHENEEIGDILVFLPGKEEVDTVVLLISDRSSDSQNAIEAVPLYGGLARADQLNATQIGKPRCRKVVVSTNIAESNLTVEGISYVIDSGFSKIKVFNPEQNSYALLSLPTTFDQAIQRSSKAGRTKPGKCYRLYSPESKNVSLEMAEINRINLSSIVLFLKAIGIENVDTFDFITKPPSDLLAHSFMVFDFNKDVVFNECIDQWKNNISWHITCRVSMRA